MKKVAAVFALLAMCAPVSAQSILSGYTINITNNIAYSGAQSPANSWFFVNGHTLTGTATGAVSPFDIFVGNDVVNAPGGMTIINVLEGVGAGHVGFRTAIEGQVAIVGTPGSGNNNYVGVLGQVRASANLGGTTGAYTNGSGSLFGYNANVFTTNGATFLLNITGMEMDTSVVAGSSVMEKHSFTVVKTGLDAVQGTFDDSAIEFDDQDNTSVPWTYGISFGAYAHKWSFDNTSTLIGVQNRVVPSPASSPANIGVDMTNGTFNTAQFKGTGWLVDPNGVMINSGMTTGTPAASVCLDASNHLIKKTTTGSCI